MNENVRHPHREEGDGAPVPVAFEEEVGEEGFVCARVAVVPQIVQTLRTQIG